MASVCKAQYLLAAIFAVVLLALSNVGSANAATVTASVNSKNNLGIIKGVVRDQGGSPIADATVAIFRLGTSKLLKQVQSANDGSFLTRILPGKYTVLAVAEGFNPVTLNDVSVNKSVELVYGFRLERAGSGNTMPEKRLDRNSSKWHIRAAQMQRSIYQNREGKAPAEIDETVTVDETVADRKEDDANVNRVRSVIESNFTSGPNGNFSTLNFASVIPVGSKTEIVFVGQTSLSPNAPQRFETNVTFRPNADHTIRAKGSIAKLGRGRSSILDQRLGQLSFQAVDEWRVREGLILVYGIDYSKFFGAGNDSSITPRFGVQFELDQKTRLQAAYSAPTETRTWSQAIDLEGADVVFREPVFISDLVHTDSKPQLNKSRRLEFGIERILDNRSNIEAGAFFDTSLGRGVGINALPFDVLGVTEFSDFVAEQSGRARGVRVVYNRKISSVISAAAGYSFGSGQRLSADGLTDPTELFDESIFQSFFGQVSADLKSGTSVQTIFRLSPNATVFAIDPFKGRLAIYDPGLSVLVTQRLPRLGMPFKAQAMVDARNIFDFQTGLTGEDGSIRLSGQGRTLRGGILVRF